MLYPEVSVARQLVAGLGGVASGVSVAASLTFLLAVFGERGRGRRFLVHFWVGSLATFAGMLVALHIGGPYLFAGSGRFGHINAEPYPFPAAVITSVLAGLIVAYALLYRPLPVRPGLRRIAAAQLRGSRLAQREHDVSLHQSFEWRSRAARAIAWLARR